MRTFREWMAENKPEVIVPDGPINGLWFEEHNIPMVVHCSSCKTNMTTNSTFIDNHDYTYCSKCAN